eukprot:1857566-Pyramimonas_sp.AAC.1
MPRERLAGGRHQGQAAREVERAPVVPLRVPAVLEQDCPSSRRASVAMQWKPMPRNTLLASRVAWVSWASIVLLWKA